MAGESINGRKEWFALARKSVSTSRNKVIFQSCISLMVSTSKKKSLSKRILFQIGRKLVPISKNGKFIEELVEKLVTLTGIYTKSNKMIVKSSNKSFK